MTQYFRDLVPPATAAKIGNQDPFGRAAARLNRGDSLFSATRNMQLKMQDDGNLVLYTIDNFELPADIKNGAYKIVIWASGTVGTGATHCDMQDDGNLVIYDDAGVDHWSSGSVGHPGAFLRCQDDGNLVIQDGPWWTHVQWRSNTHAGRRDGPTSGGPIKVDEPPKAPIEVTSAFPLALVKEFPGGGIFWEGTPLYAGEYPGSGMKITGEIKSIGVLPTAAYSVRIYVGGDPKDEKSWSGPVGPGAKLGAAEFEKLAGKKPQSISVVATSTKAVDGFGVTLGLVHT